MLMISETTISFTKDFSFGFIRIQVVIVSNTREVAVQTHTSAQPLLVGTPIRVALTVTAEGNAYDIILEHEFQKKLCKHMRPPRKLCKHIRPLKGVYEF